MTALQNKAELVRLLNAALRREKKLLKRIAELEQPKPDRGDVMKVHVTPLPQNVFPWEQPK